MTKKKVIAFAADAWACGKYRIIEPFNRLAATEFEDFEFFLVPWSDARSPTLDRIIDLSKDADAVVFQRVATHNYSAAISALQARGKKVYMDIDDNLFKVAPTSPAYKVWSEDTEATFYFKKALKEVDGVLISTPELAEAYKDYNDKFALFMNGIDIDCGIFAPENSRRKELDQEKTYVMWTGSSTHLDSLQIIAKELRDSFNPRRQAIFSLCSNEEFMKLFNIRKEQKLYIPHVSIDKYYNIPSMADIGLAPVVINEFNAAKSELKCIEYGIWGIPTICSDEAAYRRFNRISGGANLLVEKNSPRSWNKQINDLIDDKEKRKQMGQKAYETVLEHYHLTKINQVRYDFFKKELIS
jgi:glycosyltransferase involved in cell wall biosynthesis